MPLSPGRARRRVVRTPEGPGRREAAGTPLAAAWPATVRRPVPAGTVPARSKTIFMDTMFYRYGGFRTANRIVLEFYDSLFRTALKRYFEDMDMQRVIRHQVQFVSFLMDGPVSFGPEQIRRIHSHLDIDDGDFGEMVELFMKALEKVELEEADAAAVARKFSEYRSYVVTRGGQGRMRDGPRS